jgi:hypothetical protein
MLNKTESNPQPSSTEFKNKLQLLWISSISWRKDKSCLNPHYYGVGC